MSDPWVRKLAALLEMTVERGCTPEEQATARDAAIRMLDKRLGPWRTRDGVFSIVGMEDSHIKNCMRMIERKGWRKEYWLRFALELDQRQRERKQRRKHRREESNDG